MHAFGEAAAPGFGPSQPLPALFESGASGVALPPIVAASPTAGRGAATVGAEPAPTPGEPPATAITPPPGLRLIGGLGLPDNGSFSEGALKSFPQYHGVIETDSMTDKLTNGIQNQGMHFGLELWY